MAVARPHISWPFARGANGTINVVEQGSPEHVMSQETLVAYTPLGYRLARPEFGWRQSYMAMEPVDPSGLVNALKAFVPMARATAVSDAPQLAQLALGISEIDINVQTAAADATGADQGVID